MENVFYVGYFPTREVLIHIFLRGRFIFSLRVGSHQTYCRWLGLLGIIIICLNITKKVHLNIKDREKLFRFIISSSFARNWIYNCVVAFEIILRATVLSWTINKTNTMYIIITKWQISTIIPIRTFQISGKKQVETRYLNISSTLINILVTSRQICVSKKFEEFKKKWSNSMIRVSY